MIPLSLTIKGMYSYREEQTIDFTTLTKNHLFGIFGPVGSGKSTILEAMAFALYGETERLNKSDGRNYNMMNLKSGEIAIDFTLRAGDKNEDVYMFTVRGKRNKNDFSNISKLERKAYRQGSPDWIPLDSASGAEIIGLSYDNFRRTMIIPQGKFQEFLQLGDKDRTIMMKEIFNLSRYDLADKTAKLKNSNTSRLTLVQGQLLQVGDVDESMIGEKEGARDALVEARKEKEQSITEAESCERTMVESKNLLSKVENAERDLADLKKAQEQYGERARILDEFERCQQQFPDLMKQRKDTEHDLHASETRLLRDREELLALDKALWQAEGRFVSVQQDFDERYNLQTRWTELESIAKILEIDNEIRLKSGSLTELETEIQELATQSGELREAIKKMEASVKKAKEEMPDTKVLMEVKQWADKHCNLQEDINHLTSAAGKLKEELQRLEEKKKKVLDNETVLAHTSEDDRLSSFESLIPTLKTAVTTCQEGIGRIELEVDSLKESEVLEAFASRLTDTTECPLCGSMDHPHIYASTGVEEKIRMLTKGKKGLAKQIDDLHRTLHELAGLQVQFDATVQRISTTQEDLRLKRDALQTHAMNYTWERSLLGNVDEELGRGEDLRETINTTEGAVDKNRAEMEMLDAKATELKESYQSQQQTIAESSGRRNGLIGALRHFQEEDLSQWTTAAIYTEIKKLKETYQAVETLHGSLEKSIRDCKEKQSRLHGSITTESTAHEGFERQLQRIDDELKLRLTNAGFADIAEVERILQTRLDAKKEKIAIQTYYQMVASAEDRLRTSKEQAGDATYDSVAHQEVMAAITEAKRELGGVNEEIGQLNILIADLAKRLRTKRELDAEKSMLDLRAANLATLEKLFRGSGFVNFASRLYLEHLCRIANERFTQLTRQKLRLELNANNAFEVRDFLNDGKLRSVKTLSGGQTFQASLCLALGLADSLQQLARANESFFFLDEGFGSLDKDSLQVVFEALKSLRKDNRIVGVISHIEEMQQEIFDYVKTRLDPELGTVLEYN